MLLSIVEENYLKAIYKILELNTEPVSTNALAEKMNIKAATATDMLKRLSEKELINYVKYQGVTLTEAGNHKALYIIRKHRLWEMFLVEKLGFSWDEVHEVAEQLEHINSSKLIDELDRFLDYPTVDPHGDPIPSAEGSIAAPNRISLSQFETGNVVKVSGVKDHSASFLNHLSSIGIELGACIKIMSSNEYDRSLTILINDKTNCFISHQVAENLLVN